MSNTTPTLLWLRRDLRLADHPALTAAIERGGPVIPVFIRDGLVDGLGAAPKWRLGLGLERFAKTLEALGSSLILRSGDALKVLRELAQETGAGAVYWSRGYDPLSIERDTSVKAGLKQAQIEAESFSGHLLFEPWTVKTKTGGFFRVYSPMWKSVRNTEIAEPLPAPDKLTAPQTWPESEDISNWHLGAAMDRGAAICLPYQTVGEAAATARLEWFLENPVSRYASDRDFPGLDATSGLSENLALGEISPRVCWHAGHWAMRERSAPDAENWVKELVWREFAYHLVYHTPQITTRNWREAWDSFPWNDDEEHPDVIAWKQGRTGEPFVDAAMREMYVTGRMHNRARMIVASYLTKHLLSHWKIGMRWFDDCLTDWDPASNAMGWQWAAGCGPDAAPYFRIFNPATQLEKFDKDRSYRKRWISENERAPSDTALSYFQAIPRSWGLAPDADYPTAVVSLSDGRARALEAYENRSF
ncbi:MAG: deoxyribodipyrimidine photo-lyase [Pseudomonadota bacterium]